MGVTTIDYKELCQALGGGFSDSGTDSAYTLTTESATVYWFVKLSDTSLNYSIEASGITTGPIMLDRQ